MAKDKDRPNAGSAMTVAPPVVDEVAASLALSKSIDEMDLVDDGLGEVDASDIKLSAKIWNMKGKDAAGEPIPMNVFFDTVTEQSSKTLDLVFVNLSKTNEWREFDEAEQATKIRCRSYDRRTGTMEDGTERPCEGCPDAKWTTALTKDGKSKRTRRCGIVFNAFAYETETRAPCVLRFRRTSLPVIQSHLNKHHIGRRTVGLKRANWPLFSFHVRASLKLVGEKTVYAVPVLERGAPLGREEIEQAARDAAYVREVLLAHLAKVVEADAARSGADDEGDTSFDTAAMGGSGAGGGMAGGEGQDFVDPPAGSAAAG
jgi:hypothetical protein